MLRPVTLVLTLMLAAASHGQQPVPYGRTPYGQTPYGQTLDGHKLTTLGDPHTKVVVLFFLSTDCPISNRMFPEMKRLREEFSGQGIRLWFVYANAGESPAAIRTHQAAYDPAGEVLLDPTGSLTHLTQAKVTPEAAILIPAPNHPAQWIPTYVGRIDNRYVSLGHERPQATEHFAERVLREILDGRPVEKATGSPVGCSIITPREASSARGKQ